MFARFTAPSQSFTSSRHRVRHAPCLAELALFPPAAPPGLRQFQAARLADVKAMTSSTCRPLREWMHSSRHRLSLTHCRRSGSREISNTASPRATGTHDPTNIVRKDTNSTSAAGTTVPARCAFLEVPAGEGKPSVHGQHLIADTRQRFATASTTSAKSMVSYEHTASSTQEKQGRAGVGDQSGLSSRFHRLACRFVLSTDP